MTRRNRRRCRPAAEPPTAAGHRWDALARVIEASLLPGAFVGYDASWRFVTDLEAVREEIRRTIDGQQAQRAVALLELFIAGCYEKSEEIDDSSGNFGAFVATLFCDWIRARQAAGANPAETVRVLLSWMEHDDYGYCHRLEGPAVAVLDRTGLAALEQAVRDAPDADAACPPAASQKLAILKAIHAARRDVPAYAALCEEAGDLAPADCETLAQLSLQRRRPEDALAWVERGLALEAQGIGTHHPAWQLARLRREILQKLGLGEEALASAWEAYRRAPSVLSYGDLMNFVAKDDRAEWHAKALAALDGADLSARIRLFVATKEWARLADVVEATARASLAALSHTVTEPAAKKLRRSHPLLAAKLHAAMALRILEARKSAYYEAALQNLGTARHLLLREAHAEQWQALAAEIRSAHRRKTSFLPGFERIAAGRSGREPSLRERARRRWRQRAEDGGQRRW